MRTKPVFGMVAGALCVAAWIGTTVGDVLQSAEEVAPIELAYNSDIASQLVPTLIGAGESELEVTTMTEQAVNLAQSYEVGEATCHDTLTRVDECLGALQTDFVSCQSQPYWESSHNQLMSIRSELPCCGASDGGYAATNGGFVDGGGILGGGVAGGFVDGGAGAYGGGAYGEQIVAGSEQVVGEQIIGEQIIGPVPMDQACLPAPGPVPFGPEQIAYGGGQCCGGGGGGGGGGFFGGGNLLGLAGLGIGIAALASNDDDGGNRTIATPIR